ncbi:tyrosine-type recombinase/integrase [Sphingobium yanoikuyae]|uniref:tyrosine-type recombinase/integrase n=1 Tax=Sphingobium yanoikuyae TaxID=13690 RepID=UPI0028DD24A6|nr:integrase arm-type DNA-binding domain-containing protein [Sphingobium yanoikuyae]
MALTVAEVKNAKPGERDYKLADSAGLHLFVSTKGAKSWRFKYRFAGKEKRLTFGLFPDVTLADARDQRDAARAIVRAGKDPAVEAEKAKHAAIAAAGATFKAIAEEWMEDETPGWSVAHASRVRFRLERDIYPSLGKLPISDITGPMVLRELRKIEKRGSIETAKRVKGYVQAVFHRAEGEHFIDGGAVLAISRLSKALKPTPTGSKQPALTKVPELLKLQQAVDRSTSDIVTKLASRLLALTVVRVGVLRQATWDEFEGINWEKPDAPAPGALWRISAGRMKLEVEDKGNEAFGHEVPLPTQAVEILRTLRIITGKYQLLFPGGKSWREPMSDAALSSLYKRMAGGKYKGRMVPHGWRSAFSTIMNERAAVQRFDSDRMLIDMMLAHVPKGMSASEWAYNRARYLDPRRELGQAWADIITEGLVKPMIPGCRK